MHRRSPWVVMLTLASAGSWLAHVIGRSMTMGPREGSEAAEQLERVSNAHGGAIGLGVAAGLAPLAAIALVVLVAWLWTRLKGRSWRGASAAWFLILPAVAYVMGEVLERLMSGGSEALSLHAAHEPGFLLALALQVPFGAVAFVIAALLVAAARAIVAQVRGSHLAERRSQPAGVEPIARVAPTRWSCLVGAHGLRGPPVVLPS
jgi:hypothetical protein